VAIIAMESQIVVLKKILISMCDYSKWCKYGKVENFGTFSA